MTNLTAEQNNGWIKCSREAERLALRIEVEKLQKALAFWLPHRPNAELPKDLEERLEHDIGLLCGYMGHMGKDAEELGWVTLNYTHAVSEKP